MEAKCSVEFSGAPADRLDGGSKRPGYFYSCAEFGPSWGDMLSRFMRAILGRRVAQCLDQVWDHSHGYALAIANRLTTWSTSFVVRSSICFTLQASAFSNSSFSLSPFL